MKTINLLTFHQANNYGALLQASALKKFLTNYYNTQVINYKCKKLYNEFDIKASNIKEFVFEFRENIKKIIKRIIYYKRYISFTKYRKQLLHNNNKNTCDCNIYITGSDQVWNPKITGGLDNMYLLEPFKDCKKISYAASCGSIKELDGYNEVFLSKVKSIDKISVREQELKNYLNNNIDNNVDLVLDPTLLLTKDEWLSQIDEERLVKDKYIFVYSVGNDNSLFIDTVNELSRKTGYKIVYFDRNDIKNRFKCKKENWYKAGPREFLNLLLYSEYVVSTSYHALALSTILNKEIFITLSSKPDRLITLCDIAGLNNRIVNSVNDIDKLTNEKIDWKTVDSRIEIERKKSQQWLIDAIEK